MMRLSIFDNQKNSNKSNFSLEDIEKSAKHFNNVADFFSFDITRIGD